MVLSCKNLVMRFAIAVWSLATLSIASGSETVDFSYAFAPPHRITVGQPGASEKTLLDLEPDGLTVSWSYDDLRQTPLAIFRTPRTQWRVRVEPVVDGKPAGKGTWTRDRAGLPLLDVTYAEPAGSVRLESIGGKTAALWRVTARNSGSERRRIGVRCEVKSGWVAHNPAWIQEDRDAGVLLACQSERPDRVLMFATGAETYPVDRMAMLLEWTLAPGETKQGWLVRPYQAYEADLPGLRTAAWSAQFDEASRGWNALLARAVRFTIPDAGVRSALYAGLADLFIMREPLAGGYVGTLCGTEGYRSTNPFEPALTAIALDQMGFHGEAADGLRVHIDMQEADGNWADPKGWTHDMWGASGMKAWAAMEHFRLTGNRAYLEALYPHLAASSRWQELQRCKSRMEVSASRPPTYGLMPRGMGDGGLMNGKDYFGIFYPHNILAVFADKLAVEAAELLGRESDAGELRRIYSTALADLRASLERGAMEENGYRWIPGSPNNPSGSRWGALLTAFPTGILEPRDALVTGTLRKIEASISPGGQPVHTGWMEDGAWVAISLDNVAEAHLVRDEGDAAVAYLYSTLNHATPLFTWCEERGLEPGAKKVSGDRQHLWTPLSVVRFVRDALVMERGRELHLGLGTARSWLDQGKQLGVEAAPTHFGPVSYQLRSDVEHGVIRAEIEPPRREAPRSIVLHIRHPRKAVPRRVSVNGHAWTDFDGENIRLDTAGRRLSVEAAY